MDNQFGLGQLKWIFIRINEQLKKSTDKNMKILMNNEIRGYFKTFIAELIYYINESNF